VFNFNLVHVSYVYYVLTKRGRVFLYFINVIVVIIIVIFIVIAIAF
jgi:hypothetical protein